MPSVNLALRAVPVSELDAWLTEGRQPLVHWHPEYPCDGSYVGARILREAGHGEPPWGYWQILTGDEVIGDIGFHGPPTASGVVEIGYEIVPAWQRRGVATWAVGELLAIGIEHGVQEFRAEVHGDNIASVRVLQRSGFTCSGTEADTTLWTRNVDAPHSS